MKRYQHIVLGATIVLMTAGAAAAQSSPAPSAAGRWAQWIGCWQLAEESVRDTAALAADLAGVPAAATSRGIRVCVAPSDDGVTMTTLVNDQTVRVETVVADGTERRIADDQCRGWQKAEWSTLAPRVFATAEITCGDQPVRRISGMSGLASGPTWLDIQVVESQGRKSVLVKRYRRAASRNGEPRQAAPATATMPLGGKPSLAEIKEAAGKVQPEVLQAAVLELGGNGFELTGKRLLELDAAGVPDSVTDLMVAMSFPQRFVVERASGGAMPMGADPMWGNPWMYDPWMYYSALWPMYGMWSYYDDWWSPFGAYGYRGLPYYGPFGYRQWGYYNGYGFGVPGIVVVNPGGNGDGDIQPSGDGRVINGRGYTRIRRVEPAPATRTGSGTGGWRGASANDGGGSGSNGGASSGGGYSSGSSGGSSGGRVAVPRPPGGR